jgi:hypothetical protein
VILTWGAGILTDWLGNALAKGWKIVGDGAALS